MATPSLVDFFKENPTLIEYNDEKSEAREAIYYIKTLIKDNPQKEEIQLLTYFFQKYGIEATRANYNIFDKAFLDSLKKSGDIIWESGRFKLSEIVYTTFKERDYDNSLEKQLLLSRTRKAIYDRGDALGWPSPDNKNFKKLFPISLYRGIKRYLFKYIYKNFIYPEHDAISFVDEYYNEV